MAFRELLLAEFDEEMKKTRRVLESVPDEKLAWKPHEKSMLLGQLAGHIAQLAGRLADVIETDTLVRAPGYRPYVAASRTELLERFENESKRGRDAIGKLEDAQLPHLWILKLGDKVVLQLPRSMALRSLCMNHLVHHRAQLGVYLRLLDIAVPGVYGPSADEPKYA